LVPGIMGSEEIAEARNRMKTLFRSARGASCVLHVYQSALTEWMWHVATTDELGGTCRSGREEAACIRAQHETQHAGGA
jgi:hypothetical protein